MPRLSLEEGAGRRLRTSYSCFDSCLRMSNKGGLKLKCNTGRVYWIVSGECCNLASH